MLQLSLIAYFITLGSLAGILALLHATALAWVLAAQVFHFPYQFNPMSGLVGIGMGIAVVGVAGVLWTRTVLTQPPVVSLRQGV